MNKLDTKSSVKLLMRRHKPVEPKLKLTTATVEEFDKIEITQFGTWLNLYDKMDSDDLNAFIDYFRIRLSASDYIKNKNILIHDWNTSANETTMWKKFKPMLNKQIAQTLLDTMALCNFDTSRLYHSISISQYVIDLHQDMVQPFADTLFKVMLKKGKCTTSDTLSKFYKQEEQYLSHSVKVSKLVEEQSGAITNLLEKSSPQQQDAILLKYMMLSNLQSHIDEFRIMWKFKPTIELIDIDTMSISDVFNILEHVSLNYKKDKKVLVLPELTFGLE